MKVFLDNEPNQRGETEADDNLFDLRGISNTEANNLVVWVVTAKFREAIMKRDRDEKARMIAGMKINTGLRPDASLDELMLKIREMSAE